MYMHIMKTEMHNQSGSDCHSKFMDAVGLNVCSSIYFPLKVHSEILQLKKDPQPFNHICFFVV